MRGGEGGRGCVGRKTEECRRSRALLCLAHRLFPPRRPPLQMLPKGKLLSDAEWRSYGVQQSRGWEHYAGASLRARARASISLPRARMAHRLLPASPRSAQAGAAHPPFSPRAGHGPDDWQGARTPVAAASVAAAVPQTAAEAGAPLHAPPPPRSPSEQVNPVLRDQAVAEYKREFGIEGGR